MHCLPASATPHKGCALTGLLVQGHGNHVQVDQVGETRHGAVRLAAQHLQLLHLQRTTAAGS